MMTVCSRRKAPAWGAPALAFALFFPGPGFGQDAWTQWGGPQRDFVVRGIELAGSWPQAGPTEKWRRPLGEGYAGIVARGDRIFTHYRVDNEEIVIAARADTGETLWEHRYEVEDYPAPQMGLEYGNGPLATPLLVGDRLFTAGIIGRLTALDAESGEAQWSKELIRELGGTVVYRGYSSSPLAWGDTLIMSVGGEGHAVMAFRQSDGELLWQRHDYRNAYSSPQLIEVGGQQQVVQLMGREVIGLDPATGDLLWSHPHEVSEMGMNISTPALGPEDLLFVSSSYGGGSRVLELRREGETTVAEELWHTNRLRVQLTNAVWYQGQFIGATGDFGPTPLFGVGAESGDIEWRDRALSRANLLVVGDKLLLLSEDGKLAVGRTNDEGFELLAEAQLLEGRTWTAPTLVGKTVFIRSREEMLAVELP